MTVSADGKASYQPVTLNIAPITSFSLTYVSPSQTLFLSALSGQSSSLTVGILKIVNQQLSLSQKITTRLDTAAIDSSLTTVAWQNYLMVFFGQKSDTSFRAFYYTIDAQSVL